MQAGAGVADNALLTASARIVRVMAPSLSVEWVRAAEPVGEAAPAGRARGTREPSRAPPRTANAARIGNLEASTGRNRFRRPAPCLIITGPVRSAKPGDPDNAGKT